MLLEGSNIKLPSDAGADFSCLTRAQSDFLLRRSGGALVLERLPLATVAVGKDVTIPTRQGQKVWPQAVRLRTGQFAGRLYLWLDLSGDNPVLATPLQTTVQSRLLPDLRPVLIEMKSAPVAAVQGPPSELRHTVDQVVGKPQDANTFSSVQKSKSAGPAPARGRGSSRRDHSAARRRRGAAFCGCRSRDLVERTGPHGGISVMHRSVRTIMTTIALTLPLAATAGDDASVLPRRSFAQRRIRTGRPPKNCEKKSANGSGHLNATETVGRRARVPSSSQRRGRATKSRVAIASICLTGVIASTQNRSRPANE